MEDAPLAFNPKGHDFFSYYLAIGPGELDKLIKPASGLEESVRQMEGEGQAIALLPSFQILEEPPDVSEEQIPDLRLLMERRIDLGKRVLSVPVLVGPVKTFVSGGAK